MNFWKTFFASFLALTIFSILSFVLMLMIIGALSADQKPFIASQSVLHLKLDAEFTEQQIDDPFRGFPFPGGEIQNIGLLKLKEVIRHAKNNPKIEGIYLNASYPMAGFTKMEEIRESLIDFKETGKWVIAYSEVMSEGAYYVSTAADKVYLNPQGEVEFNGLTVEMSFFKKMLDKLEIKPVVFRAGDYKSAVEPFVLEKMSPENRLQLTELVGSIYDHVLAEVAASRNMDVERVREISSKMLAQNAALAVEHGLVDSLVYQDQIMDVLRTRLGLKENAKVKLVKYSKYLKSIEEDKKKSDNEIAVIVADGTIMPGEAAEGIVGSNTFIEELRKARTNDKVKAIVMRINSPGGAFQASDAIWREIILAKEQKPVIASMSDYAASGGYYLAMGCDKIVAQPNTITGSIGVFSVLFDASGFLNNKLGITFDEIKTGEYGEMVTISRPMTDAEKRVWQRRTDEIYATFTSKAAEGRGVAVEDILKVASGRVWSGVQAKERGLVDVLGGYNDAIRIAAEEAGLEEYSVQEYPKRKPFLEEFLSHFSENARTDKLKKELGVYYPFYQQYKQLRQWEGMQARMPFELVIQ